jgi:uncharacterized coiled-coil DUF342 family protein
MTYREGLTAKTNELKAINEKKRGCQAKIKEISDEIESLEAEKMRIIKSINNKDLNTADDVKSAIKQLDHRINTTTMSNADQNKIIKELKNLKENVGNAESLSQIKPKLAELRQSKNA